MRLLTAGLQVRVLLAEQTPDVLFGVFSFMRYRLYILQSKPTGRYYIGSTGNLEQRLRFHNEVGRGYTARYRPWRVVYERAYATKESALAAERKIKSWKSRNMIERLLGGDENLLM